MALIDLPTFSRKEILPYEKLNQLVNALNGKFTAGFSSADIAWPLVAQGLLDMNGNEITNVLKILNIVNAAEYDSFADAVTAAGAGGTIIIPADTTYVAKGIDIAVAGLTIMGVGPGSILQLESGSTAGYLINVTSAGTGFTIRNLTLSGNTHTGSDQNGLVLNGVNRAQVENVLFDDFSGYGLYLTHTGTAGNPTTAQVSNCLFLSGVKDAIYGNDTRYCQFISCRIQSPGAAGITLTTTGANSYLSGNTFFDCIVTGAAAGRGIYLFNANSVLGDRCADNIISECKILTTTGATSSGIELSYMRRTQVRGGIILSAGFDGLTITECGVTQVSGLVASGCVGAGVKAVVTSPVVAGLNVTGCEIYSNGGAGINFTSCLRVVVSGNHVFSNTGVGVIANSSQSSSVSGNVVYSNTGGDITSTSASHYVQGVNAVGA